MDVLVTIGLLCITRKKEDPSLINYDSVSYISPPNVYYINLALLNAFLRVNSFICKKLKKNPRFCDFFTLN